MQEMFMHSRKVWLVSGILIGLGLAYLWPHEPVYAVSTDRDSGFAMATCSVEQLGSLEAVFVLDFLTGSLKGAVLNRQAGKFGTLYVRNLAADFNVDPKADPHWSMVTGLAQLNARAGAIPSPSVVYIGDRNTGKVAAYAFAFKEGRALNPVPMELVPLDVFQFRDPN